MANQLEEFALKKMLKPALEKYLQPALHSIISSRDKIELQENETEVCILLQEVNGKIIASAPIFNTEDKISRYYPLNGEFEAMDLSELIMEFVNKK